MLNPRPRRAAALVASVKRALAVLAASTIAAGALTGCTPGTDHDRAACEILGAQIREASRVTPDQYFDQISGALEHSEDMDEVLVRRLLGSLYAAGGPAWAVSVNDAAQRCLDLNAQRHWWPTKA